MISAALMHQNEPVLGRLLSVLEYTKAHLVCLSTVTSSLDEINPQSTSEFRGFRWQSNMTFHSSAQKR